MSIYADILDAQTKQGNFGGKSGSVANWLKSYNKNKKGDKDASFYYTYREYQVTVFKGKLNKAYDGNGSADPFVIVKKAKTKSVLESKTLFTTSVCKKTLVPVWPHDHSSKKLLLNCCDTQLKVLTFEVWDHDMVKDDYIGKATVDFLDAENRGNLDFDIIDDKNGNEVVGTLTISIDRLTNFGLNNVSREFS